MCFRVRDYTKRNFSPLSAWLDSKYLFLILSHHSLFKLQIPFTEKIFVFSRLPSILWSFLLVFLYFWLNIILNVRLFFLLLRTIIIIWLIISLLFCHRLLILVINKLLLWVPSTSILTQSLTYYQMEVLSLILPVLRLQNFI